jgi:hypothetical protein
VLPEEERERLDQRLHEWGRFFSTATPHEAFLLEVVCLESLRYQRCADHEWTLRAELSLRAREDWDVDRVIAAERLGRQLSQTPGLTTLRLEQTRQGAIWKRDRWAFLAQRLDQAGGWTEEERQLVADLLGIPRDERPLHAEDLATAPADELRALAQEEQERLNRMLAEYLEARDERERADAALGLPLNTPPPLQNLRRYSGDCLRRFQWAYRQLRPDQRAPGAREPFRPAVVAEPEAALEAEAVVEAPAPVSAPVSVPVSAPVSVPVSVPAPVAVPNAALEPVAPCRPVAREVTALPIVAAVPSATDEATARIDQVLAEQRAIAQGRIPNTPITLADLHDAARRRARNEPNGKKKRSHRRRRR